jgi:outer membrane autotransporter protein
LALYGQINGNVNNAGFFNGTGVVNGSVTNSGTIAPGASVGQLTVNGNYTQTSSGSYEMEVAGSNSFDRLVVNGNASLAGTLEVVPLGYKLSYGQKFEGFLQAGSVSGEFDTVLMPKGFRGRVLEDDGTLTLLAAPQSYTLVAKTGNQESVAAALDGFIPATSGDKQVVSIALDELTEKQYPGAFEQIMPSIYQSVAYLSIDLINDLAQVVDQRIGAMRLGARGLSAGAWQRGGV